MTTTARVTPHLRARSLVAEERGVVGGVEVLPFGVLLFVALTLVLANAWAVVDAKLAVEDAAREAARAYVEAHHATAASTEATNAARSAMAGAGRDPDRLSLEVGAPTYQRCEVVEVQTSYHLPGLTVPFLGSAGPGLTVHGHHREVLDPYAVGLGPRNSCGF